MEFYVCRGVVYVIKMLQLFNLVPCVYVNYICSDLHHASLHSRHIFSSNTCEISSFRYTIVCRWYSPWIFKNGCLICVTLFGFIIQLYISHGYLFCSIYRYCLYDLFLSKENTCKSSCHRRNIKDMKIFYTFKIKVGIMY